MKLPIHIAIKLHEMSSTQEGLNSSTVKHAIIDRMIQDGVLVKKQLSNTKSKVFIRDSNDFATYLRNQFGIDDLFMFILTYQKEENSRAELVKASSDSKLKSVRTFEGFMVNVLTPIKAQLSGKEILVSPSEGSLLFINEFKRFSIDKDIVVVGIENAENFIQLKKQAYLFEGMNAIFVCRYPQNNDLIKWLMHIPNPYLHFGDIDIAGIQIYINEFRKHLGSRASFFLPSKTESLLISHGNRDLFNKQLHLNDTQLVNDSEVSIREAYQFILQHKKVLEQEAFIQT